MDPKELANLVDHRDAQHGPRIFALEVFQDGTIRWNSPNTGNPAIDEVMLRGWMDKAAEAVKQAIAQANGTTIVRPS
jgi:hypothetical protein